MRKQLFESLPAADELPGLFEILRYENATQRAELASLQEEIDRLKDLVDTMEDKLDRQQEVIDLYNAELVALRGAAAR